MEPPHLVSASSSTSSSSSSSSASDSSYPSGVRMEKPEGYDYEFVPKVDERYECSICLLVLREPRQTQCGHRFCRDCIHKWLRESQHRCPVDNEPLTESDLFPDNFAKREIQNFSVLCPNKKLGCDVITTVKLVLTHQSECPYSQVPCPNKCQRVIQRRELLEHMLQHCERRLISCSDCQQSFYAIELENHTKSCPKGLVHCEHCGEEIVRELFTSHDGQCPEKIVACSFASLGCEVTIRKCDFDAHLRDSIIVHLNLLCETVTRLLQLYNVPTLKGAGSLIAHGNMSPMEMTSIVSGIGHSVQQLSMDMARTSESSCLPKGLVYSSLPANSFYESDGSSSTSKTMQQRTDLDPKQQLLQGAGAMSSPGTLEASMLDYSSACSDPYSGANLSPASYTAPMSFAMGRSGGGESLCKSSISLQDEQKLVLQGQSLLELQAKVENMEKVFKQKVLKQHEQQISEMEGRICHGQFFWKIRNYSRYQREAERGETSALHSQPFYTSPSGGYKLCVRANLNGVDSARGSHLSLFIHFMQGDFDDVVDWPFSGRIILSVMDQNDLCELRQHVTETLTAKPNLAAFQKPTTPRNHKGFGYMEFLPLSTLKNSSYIKNDTLIIKVQVEPNG